MGVGYLGGRNDKKLQNGLHACNYESNTSVHGTNLCIENFKAPLSLSIHCHSGLWRLRIDNEFFVKTSDSDAMNAIFQQFLAVPGSQLLVVLAYTSYYLSRTLKLHLVVLPVKLHAMGSSP